MSPKEAKEFLDTWLAPDQKVFIYRREFLPDEFILIQKYGWEEFSVLEGQSTYLLKLDDQYHHLIELLHRGILIHQHMSSYYVNTWKLKTGGCTCGSWAVGSDFPHDFHCLLYK